VSAPSPIKAKWEGDVFRPLPRFASLADQNYTVGEIYVLDAQSERSKASHRHYFARLKELWQNLPEELATLYPTVDILRAHALIQAGYNNSIAETFETAGDALKVAAFLRKNEYCLVVVKKRVVIVYTAKSQAELQMDPDTFQKSKNAVLEFAEALVATPVTERGHL
jgi:hypothetical protein